LGVDVISREAGVPVAIGPLTLTVLRPQNREDGGSYDAMRIELEGRRTTIDAEEGMRLCLALREWLLAATGASP
jgi:hypothetical protein